jgi:hypothetical protein
MSDEDPITQAHEEFIKKLFKNFCDAYTSSNSSIQAEGKANLPKRNQSRRSEHARSCFTDPAQ